MNVHCDLLGWFALAHLLVVLPVVELPCWTYKSVVATPSLLHPSRLLDSIDDGGSHSDRPSQVLGMLAGDGGDDPLAAALIL